MSAGIIVEAFVMRDGLINLLLITPVLPILALFGILMYSNAKEHTEREL